MSKNETKQALKTIKFWFKALLASNLMDDKQHRLEYLNAIKVFKKKDKKEVV